MGPKKKEAPKAAGGEGGDTGDDPKALLSNYQKYSKSIGIQPNQKIAVLLNDEEKYPIKQIVIDDEFGPLGPGGCRALMTSLMGIGPGMKGGPYKLLNSIRIWKSNITDDGAGAIAEVLRLGGAEVQISYLELFDNNIGHRGAMALGQSLKQGNNMSLLNLKLDYNTTMGALGVEYLCRGLRTNTVVKQLHLAHCKLPAESCAFLSHLLLNAKSGLEQLNLQGNSIMGAGLSLLCKGLEINTKLAKLNVADNLIDQTDEDLVALEALKDVLMIPTSGLTHIDLMYNRIGLNGANVLQPALTEENVKVKEFLVDLTLPMDIFEKIFRRDSGKKGKKGKGGGKKKKK
jgi:hypothetical protein